MQGRVAVFSLGLMLALTAGAKAQDAQSWCKSKWGPNDEKGAANLLNPQLALEAAKLMKTGKVYPLGVETNSKTPAFPPRSSTSRSCNPGRPAAAASARPRPPTMTTSSPAGSASARSWTGSATSASTTSTTTATRAWSLPLPTA